MKREVSEVMFSYFGQRSDVGQSQSVRTKQTSPQRHPRKPEAGVRLPPLGKSHEPTSTTLNQVDADKLWTESVTKEKAIASSWQTNWSFLCEDAQTDTQRDDNSLKVPATTSQTIGATLTSLPGQRIQQLEFSFNSVNRRRPIDKELINC